MKFISKIGNTLVGITFLLISILVLINLGWFFNIPNKISQLGNIVKILSTAHDNGFISVALSTIIASSTLITAIVSIVFTLKKIPYHFAFKYFIDLKLIRALIAVTIFLIFYSFGLLIFNELPLINLFYFFALFIIHISLSIYLAYATFKSTQEEELLKKLLPQKLLRQIKDIEISTTDPDETDLNVFYDYYKFGKLNYPYKVQLSTKREGVVTNINFDQIQKLFKDKNIDSEIIGIYSHVRPGIYIPNVFDFSYSPYLDSFNVFIVGTNNSKVFEILKQISIQCNDEIYGSISFSEKNDLISQFNTHIGDIFYLLKHQSGAAINTVNWLHPIEEYFKSKRLKDEDISNLESILIFRLLHHIVYDRNISINSYVSRNIVTLIYILSGLLRTKENLVLGRITLDLLDHITHLLIKENNNQTDGMVYSIVLRYKEIVSISAFHNQREVINSEYFKFMAIDGINRVTSILANIITNRGIYSDAYINRIFEHNLQSYISFLGNYRHTQPPWFTDVASHLAKQILYFSSLLFISDYKYKSEGISGYNFFSRYGVYMIRYCQSSLRFDQSPESILNSIVNDIEFNEPSNPQISSYFENPIHQAGGYTPEYFDFNQVWLCYLLSDDSVNIRNFNKEFQREIIDLVSKLSQDKIIIYTKVCNCSESDFKIKIDKLSNSIKDA